MEENLPSKKGEARIKKEEVSTFGIKLIFNLPEFIELDYFEERLKFYGLDKIEVFKKKELEGLISIPVNKLNIKDAIRESKNNISEPVKDAILKGGFVDKIKDEVKGSKAINSFIAWVQSTHKELKANKISKEEVKEKADKKFSDLFGDKGVEIIVNLFSQDEEHILNSWAKLEDFFIQKLSIEFYIFQQIRESSFVIVNIKSNNPELKSLVMNCEKLIVPITKDVEFYRREINLPYGKKINNIFTHNILQKVILTFNPTKATYSFIQKLLALRKTNSDLSFMTFMIEKQNDLLKNDLKDLEFDSEYVKNQAIDLDAKTLSYTIESLKHLIDAIYYTYQDYVKPSKKVSNNLTKKRKLFSEKEYNKHFKQKVTIDNIQSLIQPQGWMLELVPEFNIEKTDKLLCESEELYLNLIKLLRALREDLVEYKKAKEENNENRIQKYGGSILKIIWEIAKIKINLP